MNLQNGYKVIYEKAADGKRTFYASKAGVFADAEKILEATIGEYKLIYEKNGQFYGSVSGIPAEGDYCFEDFDMAFKAAEETPEDETPDTFEGSDDNGETGNDPVESPENDPENDPENGPTYDLPVFEEEDEE